MIMAVVTAVYLLKTGITEIVVPVIALILCKVSQIYTTVVCCFGGFAVVLAIVAVVLGGVAIKKKCALKGMAIAGLVCGIITI